jgi:F0F1-type ATP synthase epsilon subunit
MAVAKFKNNFHCVILSPKNLIFEDEVNSLYITGDRTEYELLVYHYPLVGLVQEGDIIIDWKKRVPIRSGILRFFANECTILVEETDKTMAVAKKIVPLGATL